VLLFLRFTVKYVTNSKKEEVMSHNKEKRNLTKTEKITRVVVWLMLIATISTLVLSAVGAIYFQLTN